MHTKSLCTLALTLACACAGRSGAVDREVIAPSGSSRLAPYSPAIRSGEFVFLSGQIGLRPGTRELAGGGIGGETQQALDNMRGILREAGLTPADVVKCTVFLVDMRDYAAMNEVYGRFFANEPPARTAVGTSGLPLGARVEIECIARSRT